MFYSLKNKVQLIGNLGVDPDIKKTEGGKKLARMRMATNDIYRNANGDKITDTQWHDLVAWGKNADLAEKYLVKGSSLAIEGKLVSRSFTDKAGTKKFITEVQVNEIILMGQKGDK
jgi:single-strand DNA-binding protein